MAATSNSSRGSFTGKVGFILAAAGSAVGLGNIWRFPYLTGENGGAAFVFIYILCALIITIPLLFNELAIGRHTGLNPVDAINALKPGSWLVVAGYLSVVACFLVLSYYGVVAGWTLWYAGAQALGKEVNFSEFAVNWKQVLVVFLIFMFLTMWIVRGGVQKGIEAACRFMMPLLFIIAIIVVIRSVTLEGASRGIDYYLNPDFSKINARTIMMALGQAFFSMSVGWGLMVTYGSYLSKRENIVESGLWVGILDTLVAFLGGLMVFPAVFAFGKNPAEGVALAFVILPDVFAQMPAGRLVGTLFFILLAIAALTSSISMLEVPVSYLVDRKLMTRKTASVVVALAATVVGIPSVLSQGSSEFFTRFLPYWEKQKAPQECGTNQCTAYQERVGENTVVYVAKAADGTVVFQDTLKKDAQFELLFTDGQAVSAGTPLYYKKSYMSFLSFMDIVFGTIAIMIIALLLALLTGWTKGTADKIINEIAEGTPFFTRILIGSLTPAALWLFVVRYVAPVIIIGVLISRVVKW